MAVEAAECCNYMLFSEGLLEGVDKKVVERTKPLTPLQSHKNNRWCLPKVPNSQCLNVLGIDIKVLLDKLNDKFRIASKQTKLPVRF